MIFKVFKGDGLPQNICDQCKYKLDAAYNFKIQILSTNEKLQVNYSIKISLKSDEEEFFEVKIENEVVNYEEEYENNEDISVQDIFQVELSQHDDNQKIFVVKNKKSKCRDKRKTQNNLKRIVTYEEVKQEYENNSDDSLEDIFEIESNEHISSNESETIGLVKNKKKKCGDNRKKRKNIARVCPECGRVLKMSSYYDHMLTQHNKEFKIECEICGIKLKTKRQLWHHKKKKHEEPEKISCDQCGLILASRSNFTRHYNNVHLGMCILI